MASSRTVCWLVILAIACAVAHARSQIRLVERDARNDVVGKPSKGQAVAAAKVPQELQSGCLLDKAEALCGALGELKVCAKQGNRELCHDDYMDAGNLLRDTHECCYITSVSPSVKPSRKVGRVCNKRLHGVYAAGAQLRKLLRTCMHGNRGACNQTAPLGEGMYKLYQNASNQIRRDGHVAPIPFAKCNRKGMVAGNKAYEAAVSQFNNYMGAVNKQQNGGAEHGGDDDDENHDDDDEDDQQDEQQQGAVAKPGAKGAAAQQQEDGDDEEFDVEQGAAGKPAAAGKAPAQYAGNAAAAAGAFDE